jgi:hypothetical protein
VSSWHRLPRLDAGAAGGSTAVVWLSGKGNATHSVAEPAHSSEVSARD